MDYFSGFVNMEAFYVAHALRANDTYFSQKGCHPGLEPGSMPHVSPHRPARHGLRVKPAMTTSGVIHGSALPAPKGQGATQSEYFCNDASGI